MASESGGGVVTFRGVVYPAQCDAMGHMNAQHYIAAFDQAMWHLVLQLGFLPSWVTERRRGWADVRYVVNFKNELHAGQLFSVESTVVRIGNSSLVSAHSLSEAASGVIAAEIEMTSIYFDLEKRTSRALPPSIRQAAKQMLASAALPADPDHKEGVAPRVGSPP